MDNGHGGAIGLWAVLATDVSAQNTFQERQWSLSRLLQRRGRAGEECSRSRGRRGKGGGPAMGLGTWVCGQDAIECFRGAPRATRLVL